jgi:hypothetical protein
MSTFLVGDKGETVRDLFYKRSMYIVLSPAGSTTPVTDFYVAEKQLYGKVNFDYVPIVLKNPQKSVPFRAHKAFSARFQQSPATPHAAPAYLVDAFEAMAGAFERALVTGQIPPGHKYLSTLKVYGAYKNVRDRYSLYMRNYVMAIAPELQRMKLPITTMTDLVHFYELYLLPRVATEHPLTLSAFIKGSHCSRLHTGLSIDIADLSLSNDAEKYKQFLSAPAWQFYVNAAREYGFLIDRHIPWRLVADIGSEAFLKSSTKYGLNNTAKILNLGYRKAFNEGFVRFMNFFLDLYQNSVKGSLERPRLCGDGKIRYFSVAPKKYDLLSMLREIPEERFLRLYMTVRMQEEETAFTADQRKILINECMGLYEIGRDREFTLEVFSRIVNKTFDYRGSLSYIIERRKLRQAAQTTTGVGGSMSSFNNSSDTGTGGGGGY